MSNHRYAKFWWQDHSDDPCLRICSLAAQGLWMRLLCIAAAADPIGHLLIDGEPPTLVEISLMIGKPLKVISRLVAELERRRVFSRTETGVIFSRRMVRDALKSQKGTDAAARRWGNDPPNGSGNGKAKDDPMGDPIVYNHRSESESYTRDPNGSSADPGPRSQTPKPKLNLIFPGDPWPVPAVQRSAAASERRPLPPERTLEEQKAILEAMIRAEKSA